MSRKALGTLAGACIVFFISMVVAAEARFAVSELFPTTGRARVDRHSSHQATERQPDSTAMFSKGLDAAVAQLHSSAGLSESASEWRTYADNEYEFVLKYPPTWAVEITLNNPGVSGVIQRQISFRAASGALVVMDVWANELNDDLMGWLHRFKQSKFPPEVALPEESNASVSGVPAVFVVWTQTPQSPAALMATFLKGRWVYRLSYVAADAGQAEDSYRTMLATVRLGEDSGGATAIPPLLRKPWSSQSAMGDDTCCGYSAPGNPYNCFGCGNCVWWAWYKRPDLPRFDGNANNWCRAARDRNLNVQYTPVVGAIAVSESMGSYGHVAYVEEVSGSRFRVSEMWYGTGCPVNTCCGVCFGNWYSSWSCFIYPPGGSCTAPTLIEPSDGAILGSRTVTFRWNAVSGCTFNGYTFRVKNTSSMDSGGTTIIDTGEAGTSRTETLGSQWDNQDLYWGVKAANAPAGANWAVRRFRISLSSPPPGSVVKLWSEPRFQGTVVWSGGTGFSNGPSANSMSMEIPGGWSVKTWRGDNRSGEERCWTESVGNLQDHGWQNAIQSIEVFSYNVCPMPPQVKLWSEPRFQGTVVWSGGTGFSNGPSANSMSMEIPGGWSVKTWRGDNRSGEERCWTESVGNLQDHGWQNAIQSIEPFNYNACPCNIPSPSSPCYGVRIPQTSNVNFSWSGNCSQYRVKYWGGPYSGDLYSPWVSSSSWSNGLWCGNYSWQVQGKSSGGVETGWSSTCSFSVVPATPTGLTASAASRSQINLSWNDPGGDKDGYKVYYSNGVYIGPTTSTSYQVTGLNCNTSYCFYVTAYKGSLESDRSDTRCATTHACPPPDTEPPVLNWVAPVGNGQVYHVGNQVIQLEVSATDNVGVSRVQFYWWDAVRNQMVDIGVDYTPPYQTSLDCSRLNWGWNEIDADAWDAAGNWRREHIWLDRSLTPTPTNTPANTPTPTRTGTRTNTPTPTPTGTLMPLPPCPDLYEPNDSFAAAWALTPGAYQSYICCRAVADVDYFRFRANIGDSIQILITNLPDDYDMCLYDPGQSEVACSWEGSTRDDYVSHRAERAGDYYVMVWGYAGACSSGSPYTLRLTVTTPTRTATPTPTPTPGEIRRQLLSQEAEHGTIRPPMTIGADPAASNGSYVYSPVSYEGYVNLQFCVLTEGSYELWGRVWGEGYGADSFFVMVDDGPETVWDIPISGWTWHAVSDRAGPASAQMYYLAAGTHTVRVRAREARARLDVLALVPRFLYLQRLLYLPVVVKRH